MDAVARSPVQSAAAKRGLQYLVRSHWSIPLAFFICQCGLVAAGINGPFLDEAIYTTLGLEFLRGQPAQLDWLGGSAYLFPLLAGAGYALGGLIGARLLTALPYTLTLWLFSRFVSRAFGRSAAVFGTALLAINGIFFSLA